MVEKYIERKLHFRFKLNTNLQISVGLKTNMEKDPGNKREKLQKRK